MNEPEPACECVRVERAADHIRVFVATITWPDGPANPQLRWALFRELDSVAGDSELQAAVGEAIASPSYFATCQECGQRKPLGWMYDDRICQSCAERIHGVVY